MIRGDNISIVCPVFLAFSFILPYHLQDQADNASPTSSLGDPKFHIGFGVAYNATLATGNIRDALKGARFPLKSSWNGSDHATWSLGAECNLTDHFRVAGSITQIPDLAFHSAQEGAGASEGATAMCYSLLIAYVPSPVVYLFTSRLELAVGAGVVYNSASVWNGLYSYDNAGGTSEDVFSRMRKKAFGVQTRVSLDYYFHRNLSGQFKVDGKILQSVHVPAIRFTNTIINEAYVLPDHSVNFSSLDLSLNLRFHF
jgi:hypothetical protein